ncbi:MAG: AAA family ATPase [Anaerolineales bacterium]|nr:AAA family ATPase [Anaerolineales bacterium]
MRLVSFTIKNYRSVQELEGFTTFDTNITTFIGGNGTGKSNILRALASLKKPASISDDDFYADPLQDKDLVIKARFLFTEADAPILENLGLVPNATEGFEVFCSKARGQKAKIEISSIGSGEPASVDLELIRGRITEIRNLVDKTDLGSFPDKGPEKEKILQLVAKLDEKDFQEIEKLIEELKGPGDSLSEIIAELPQQISNVEKKLKINTEQILGNAFDNLSIELLDIADYGIESQAPVASLKEREGHPFLYDLLELSGQTADSFETATHTRLVAVQDSASETLSTKIGNVWKTHRLEFIVYIDRGDLLTFNVRNPQGRAIRLEDLSEGEKWFLRFYTRLAIAGKNKQNVLWLFDEPGRDLHARSQMDLKSFFEDISRDSQIIYTTHQPMMMPWQRLERIYVVENVQDGPNKENGTVVHKRFWKDEELSSPLREALALFVGEELLTGKEHVVVEGVSDYFYLQAWLKYFQNNSIAKKWSTDFSELTRSFIPVAGIDKVPLYLLFLGKESKNQVNWVAIVDSGQKYSDLKKKLSGSGLSTWSKKVKSVKELSQQGDTGDFDIEDLFEADEYINEFKSYYSQFWPNVVIPDDNELNKIKAKGSIAKHIQTLLQAVNPKIGNPPEDITLDKIGIAQMVYLKLSRTKSKSYSIQAEGNFNKVLTGINTLFKA